MNIRTIIAGALICAVGGAYSALAQGGKKAGDGGDRPRLAKLLKKADTNNDGKVTFDELRAVAPKMTQERFNALDTNHDGVLTAADKPADGPAGGDRAEMMKKADANHDGKITFAELKAVAPKMTQDRFNALDANHDGVLTPEDRALRGGKGPGQKKGASGAEADQIKKLLETDANHDGKVTYEEVVARKPGFPKETFARYDANGDGVLSAADIKPAR